MREINIESPIGSFEHKEHFALLSANNTIFSTDSDSEMCIAWFETVINVNVCISMWIGL